MKRRYAMPNFTKTAIKASFMKLIADRGDDDRSLSFPQL